MAKIPQALHEHIATLGPSDSANALRPPAKRASQVGLPGVAPEEHETVLSHRGGRKTAKEDLPSEALSDLEREVRQAIVSDENLVGIVPLPAKLARDLVAMAPGVSVPREIASAGAWLRANPERRKKHGARFLVSWVERSQERCGRVNGQQRNTAVGGGANPDTVNRWGVPRQPSVAEADRCWETPEPLKPID